MTGDGFVQEAVDELYTADPGEFVARRGALAAQARAAGDAPAAKRISALRKPTRSAWVVNQLVRCEPSATAQLTKLGEELRLAQEALDGGAIRELSQRRRQLVDGLTKQAFAVSGQQSPPAALREEVTATLGAALVDPQVAEQLRAGTLDRALQGSGFGSAESPTLTAVPSPAGRRRAPAATKESAAPADKAAGGSARPAARPAASVTALAAARERAERERRRQAARDAKQEMTKADRAAGAAARAEEAAENALQVLEEQLADARERLTDARAKARRARSAQRQARRAVDRMQE